MKAPEPKVIELTDEQVKQLAEFYTYAHMEHNAGRTGMLVAQVGDTRFGGHQFIKVGFVRDRIAKTIAETVS